MPPRHNYWTIIVDDKPTAFRAAEQDELLPTLRQMQARHPDAVMKWFARGRLWESQDSERADAAAKRRPPMGDRRPAAERRGRDWRPGGEHKDPRERFKIPRDEKRRRFAENLHREGPATPPHADNPAGEPSRPPQENTGGLPASNQSRGREGQPPWRRDKDTRPPRDQDREARQDWRPAGPADRRPAGAGERKPWSRPPGAPSGRPPGATSERKPWSRPPGAPSGRPPGPSSGRPGTPWTRNRPDSRSESPAGRPAGGGGWNRDKPGGAGWKKDRPAAGEEWRKDRPGGGSAGKPAGPWRPRTDGSGGSGKPGHGPGSGRPPGGQSRPGPRAPRGDKPGGGKGGGGQGR